MENLTVAKILTGVLPRLRVQTENVETWDTNYVIENQYKIIDHSSFIGMEMEIEHVQTKAYINPIWLETRDDSLRNGGREYISLPIPAKLAEKSLKFLFERLDLREDSYTPRTSIHIHLNVRTLTIAQLKGLLLTYMVFEKALFNWIGGNREENIFCVPLHSINLTDLLIDKLEDIKNLNWMKYTAVNLLPILEKGSIEFRQMVGTSDIGSIIKWINFILCLKIYALKVPYTKILQRIFLLNTKSDYREFLYEVFKNHQFLSEIEYRDLEKDMSYCVTNIKQSCISNPFHLKASEEFNIYALKNIKSNLKLRTSQNVRDELDNLTTIQPRNLEEDLNLRRTFFATATTRTTAATGTRVPPPIFEQLTTTQRDLEQMQRNEEALEEAIQPTRTHF